MASNNDKLPNKRINYLVLEEKEEEKKYNGFDKNDMFIQAIKQQLYYKNYLKKLVKFSYQKMKNV